MKLSSIAALAALLLLPATPVRADAFAAAEAYNSNGKQIAYEWCRKSSLAAAKSCAMAACRENSPSPGRCEIAEYCTPANWAGVEDMVRSSSSKVISVCEKSTRNLALRALKNECRRYRNASKSAFEHCTVESLTSPSGNEETNVVRWEWENGDLKAQ